VKKIKTSDIVLVLIAVLTLLFVIINLILFDLHETIPNTLVTCWFSAVVGEFGVLGWIKTTKVKQQEQEREKELYERLKNDREKSGGVH
jgi:hypothetical protein